MSDDVSRWAEMTLPWQTGAGPEMDVVLKTGATLGRGLWSFPYPGRASPVERRTVLGEILRRLADNDKSTGDTRLALEEQSLVFRQCLHEKGLLGIGTVHQPLGCGLILEPGLDRALVINETDHLRIKAWRPGFAPEAALAAVLELDGRLDRKLEFAFSEEFGYLTASPTRVGTGLRLVSLLHLPGLVMAGEIEKIVNALHQLQFAVRGLGGRGNTVSGCLFQVSNLITLGCSEEEVAENFAVHVGKIILHERSARKSLYGADPQGLEDLAQRALAVGRNARLMTLAEGFDRLSNLRLGTSLGILTDVDSAILNRLLVFQQPGHLELAAGKVLPGKLLMAARAELFRHYLQTAGT